MWHETEYDHEPNILDETSSANYIYVRKDIKEVEKEEGKIWTCFEQKIKKADWELYKTVSTNSDDLSIVREGLEEVYEMLAEVAE